MQTLSQEVSPGDLFRGKRVTLVTRGSVVFVHTEDGRSHMLPRGQRVTVK